MPERTYSERETAEILARAAHDRRLDDPDPGPTLVEIERAAAEAGIDASLVRQAAADVDTSLLVADTNRTAIAARWIDEPFSLAAWEDAVAGLRVRHGQNAPSGFGPAPPDVTQVGASHEWSHRTYAGTQTTVTVSPRGERTRVRVVTIAGGIDDLPPIALAGMVSFVVGMFAGAGVAESLGWGDLAGVLTVLLVMAAGTAVGAPLLARRTERSRARQAAEAEGLADRLANDLARQFARAAAPEGRAEVVPEASPPEARIDPTLLDASEESGAASDRGSRRDRS